jgi:CubicO group peptidase (beta-lactamase class C family)
MSEQLGSPTLERALGELERARKAGLHLGWQLSVWHAPTGQVDLAGGEAEPGVPMTVDHRLPWLSMTKPVTATAVALEWEAGRLDLDQRVVEHVPEFAEGGKERITLRHLLTHTAGIRTADRYRGPWEVMLPAILAVRPEPGWVPGQRAGYHSSGSFAVLGEIVRRNAGRPFDDVVRRAIFEPLGMTACSLSLSPEAAMEADGLLAPLFDTSSGEPRRRVDLESPEARSWCLPGSSGRGPMRELVSLWRMFLGRGSLNGRRLLSPQTVEALSARHRVGMLDRTFGIVCDWGLGVFVDSGSLGRYCSPRAFGHGGAQSSVSFADPEHALAVALVVNGMPGFPAHYRMLEATCSAIYVDLGLANEGDPGRPRPLPRMT